MKHELGSFSGRDSFCSHKAGTSDAIFQEMIAVFFLVGHQRT